MTGAGNQQMSGICAVLWISAWASCRCCSEISTWPTLWEAAEN